MAKTGFIRQTKLTNVAGRLAYIQDTAKQEHLYGVSSVAGRIDYITNEERQAHLYASSGVVGTDMKSELFWKSLSAECQSAFQNANHLPMYRTEYWMDGHKSSKQKCVDENGKLLNGAEKKYIPITTKCIEARELIIALPNEFRTIPEKNELADLIANDFYKTYGVPCQVAVHDNKDLTNFHCHLIYSERKIAKDSLSEKLKEIAKDGPRLATRDTYFYDGKRTTKTIAMNHLKIDPDKVFLVSKGCDLNDAKRYYALSNNRIFSAKEEVFNSPLFLKDIKLHYFQDFFPSISDRYNIPYEEHILFNKSTGLKPQRHEGKTSIRLEDGSIIQQRNPVIHAENLEIIKDNTRMIEAWKNICEDPKITAELVHIQEHNSRCEEAKIELNKSNLLDRLYDYLREKCRIFTNYLQNAWLDFCNKYSNLINEATRKHDVSFEEFTMQRKAISPYLVSSKKSISYDERHSLYNPDFVEYYCRLIDNECKKDNILLSDNYPDSVHDYVFEHLVNNNTDSIFTLLSDLKEKYPQHSNDIEYLAEVLQDHVIRQNPITDSPRISITK